MSDFQRIELPNGSRLLYRDHKNDRYRTTNESWEPLDRLDSVSTLAKAYDLSPGGLMWWAAKQDRIGIATLVERILSNAPVDPMLLDWLTDHETIWAKLKHAKLSYLHDTAKEVGTSVHDVFERLAKGEADEVQDLLPFLPADERTYSQALMRWWVEKQPRVLQSEQFVYSTVYEYAGRFDLRAIYDEQTTLLDLKTGSDFIPPSYHVQLEGYELASQECGIGRSDRRLILKVDRDGTWREIPSCATTGDFIQAREVFRAAKYIEEAQKAYEQART